MLKIEKVEKSDEKEEAKAPAISKNNSKKSSFIESKAEKQYPVIAEEQEQSLRSFHTPPKDLEE